MKCHVTVEFPMTGASPVIVEYAAECDAALGFATVMRRLNIAHVRIDDHLVPGLHEMPCQRLWT